MLAPSVNLVCGYLIYTLGWHAYIRQGIWLAIDWVIFEVRKNHPATAGVG